MRGTRVAVWSEEWPACYQQVPETGYMGSVCGCKIQLPMYEVRRPTCIASGKGLGGCKTTSVLCHEVRLNC